MTKFYWKTFVKKAGAGWAEYQYSGFDFDTAVAAETAARAAADAVPSTAFDEPPQWAVYNDSGVRLAAGVRGGTTPAAGGPASGTPEVVKDSHGPFAVDGVVTGALKIVLAAGVLVVLYIVARRLGGVVPDED